MPDAAETLGAVAERLLETMFFSAVLEHGGSGPAFPRYSAQVTFCGSRSGTLRVCASEQTATALAASFLGEPEVTAVQAASVIGELANILCGSLLGNLDRTGRFTIGAPQVAGEAGPEGVARLPVNLAMQLEEGTLEVGMEIT